MAGLAGRVAIVTGASRGIGKGCALELGAAGATVYVTGRTAEEGGAALPGSVASTAEEVDREGGRGIAVRCDHRDDEQVAALFERVASEQGRLDVLVNNAFMIVREMTLGLPFWETPISNWDDMIDVGLRSAYVAAAYRHTFCSTGRPRSCSNSANSSIARSTSSSSLLSVPPRKTRMRWWPAGA